MRRLCCAAVLLHTTLSLPAADDVKPNTLTPKEVADGWLLLFDGATTFGWQSAGDMKVEQGALVFPAGTKPHPAQFTTSFPGYELQFEYQATFSTATKEKPLLQVHNKTLGAELYATGKKGWHKVNATVTPSKIHSALYFPDEPQKPTVLDIDFKGQDTIKTAEVRLAIPPDSTVMLRNVKLRPLGLQSVFNGKDLAGWKEHPGKKSKFAVKDGEITVKDGPGDLQTEGQWADFVLQAECFSNGKHLNSGIFFRCRPGEYQQGYEAQIHNGWLPQPSKEYTVDAYDPETGKVVKSEKTKSAAMDYGTGAIYRRIPARQAVAKDGEWFTMTVATQGRHIATWVNGIQVVDWTDTRPVKDNARNGCKLEKGNVSLQGHDPTTDLRFRNIRIAELLAK